MNPKALLRPSLGPPYIDVPYYIFILPLLQLGIIHRNEPREPREPRDPAEASARQEQNLKTD